MGSEGKYTVTKESQMFPGIGENFGQLEAVKSTPQTAVLSVRVLVQSRKDSGQF